MSLQMLGALYLKRYKPRCLIGIYTRLISTTSQLP